MMKMPFSSSKTLLLFFWIMLQRLLRFEVWSFGLWVYSRIYNINRKVDMMSDDSDEEDVSSFFLSSLEHIIVFLNDPEIVLWNKKIFIS